LLCCDETKSQRNICCGLPRQDSASYTRKLSRAYLGAFFIDQSYACRAGKGAHKAIIDLKKYIPKVSQGIEHSAQYLQVDIQSFFVSLKKDVLFKLIKKKVKNPEVLWLTETIIFHNPITNYFHKGQRSLFDLIPDHKSLFKVAKDQGLPIGNLTSQFFANVYLNELDQFVKHKLKAKYYLRYVDDVIIVSNDNDELKIWRNKISEFLQEDLKLRLHPKKQILQGIDKGINFVGFIVKPEYTLIRRRIIGNLKEKLRIFNKNLEKISESEKEVKKFMEVGLPEMLSIVNSYYGQFKHANTFGLRQKLWQKNFEKLQKYFQPVDNNLSYFKIK